LATRAKSFAQERALVCREMTFDARALLTGRDDDPRRHVSFFSSLGGGHDCSLYLSETSAR